MNINSKILEILEEYRIRKDEGLGYLLSLYYDIEPDYIPDNLKIRVNATGIIKYDNSTLSWNIPLFEGQSTAFDWVKTEYVELFRGVNKATNSREAIARMKKLFANNPDIRKHEVLEATKLYILNTDSRFIRQPHYFIEKGVGVNKTNDILSWIEKLRENQTSISRKIIR